MKGTTIKVKGETKKLLNVIKKYENQSYDELIRDLVSEKLEEHLELKPEIKKEILKAVEEIKGKRTKTLSFDEAYEMLYG